MEPNPQEIAERDQLWATLRTLRGEIDKLAAGGFDGSERQKQIVTLLFRIVASEMDFRERYAASE
jgi:hypothetical protein